MGCAQLSVSGVAIATCATDKSQCPAELVDHPWLVQVHRDGREAEPTLTVDDELVVPTHVVPVPFGKQVHGPIDLDHDSASVRTAQHCVQVTPPGLSVRADDLPFGFGQTVAAADGAEADLGESLCPAADVAECGSEQPSMANPSGPVELLEYALRYYDPLLRRCGNETACGCRLTRPHRRIEDRTFSPRLRRCPRRMNVVRAEASRLVDVYGGTRDPHDTAVDGCATGDDDLDAVGGPAGQAGFRCCRSAGERRHRGDREHGSPQLLPTGERPVVAHDHLGPDGPPPLRRELGAYLGLRRTPLVQLGATENTVLPCGLEAGVDRHGRSVAEHQRPCALSTTELVSGRRRHGNACH
jgi:hypothetical protein